MGQEPHDLLRQASNEAALFIRGEGAATVKRLNYLLDPEFAGLFDPNPRYLPETSRGITGLGL